MSTHSSSPTPSENDPLGDIFDAMDQPSSPVRPTPSNKRCRLLNDTDTESDEEILLNAPSANGQTTTNINQNVAIAAKQYATKKKLRREQTTEIVTFLNDVPSICEAKLLINLFSLNNKLDKIIKSAPAYQVSSDLEKNIQNYAAAVLLSSKIATYKGATPTNHILAILKKHRFDMPDGIEHNATDFSKVVVAVQDALTQKHSKFKKALSKSINLTQGKVVTHLPADQQQNIYALAQVFVDGTKCSVTVPLLVCIALMRQTFLIDSSVKFWDTLDASLSKIRKKAGGNAGKVLRAFTHVLRKDQELHGVEDYTVQDDVLDDFQQEVDDIIDASILDAATSSGVSSLGPRLSSAMAASTADAEPEG